MLDTHFHSESLEGERNTARLEGEDQGEKERGKGMGQRGVGERQRGVGKGQRE